MGNVVWILSSSNGTIYPSISKIIKRRKLTIIGYTEDQLYDIINKPIDVEIIPVLIILNESISESFINRLSEWRKNLKWPGAYLSPDFLIATKSGSDENIQHIFDPHDRYDIKLYTIDSLSSLSISENIINRAIKHRKIAEHGILIGESEPIARIKAIIDKFKDFQSPVLITGPRGTGKELVARAFHSEGIRSTHPFIAVNVAAIQDNLFESMMYGYTKGSFSGADRDKAGLCQKAHLGTLFLDEIGYLSKESQPKLLRFLQEFRVQRIGSHIQEAVDVRIISATNKNLKSMIESNEFYGDLFDRLNVVSIEIPPLVERKKDLPQLIKHFVLKSSLSIGIGASKYFSQEAETALTAYDWPENVRELEHVVERCQILTESDEINFQDLPQNIKDEYDSNKPTTIPISRQPNMAETNVDRNPFREDIDNPKSFITVFEEKGGNPQAFLKNIKPLLQSVNVSNFSRDAIQIQTKLSHLINTIENDSRDALNLLNLCLNPNSNKVFNLDDSKFNRKILKILITLCEGNTKKTSNLLRVLGYIDNTSPGYIKNRLGLDKNNTDPKIDTLSDWYNRNFRPSE